MLTLLTNLRASKEFFISLGLVLLMTLIFYPGVLKGVQKDSRKGIVLFFVLNLFLTIHVSIFGYFGYALLTKVPYDYLNLYLLVTLIVSVSLDLSLAVTTGRDVSRSKKSVGLFDCAKESIKENTKKIMSVMVFLLLFLPAFFLFVNMQTGYLIGTFFIAFFICCFYYAFMSAMVCKLSERILK
jgi:hypothetical protein